MRSARLARRAALAVGALLFAGCQPDGARPRDASAAAPASGNASPTASDTALLRRADEGRLAGNPDARVWMVEISDFQCPYCRMWHDSTYPAIRREYVDAGKVRLAYVNLPLSSHRHAWPAAEAAMCAGVQDRFWPVHDGIFDRQAEWTPLADAAPVFAEVAERAGVAMPAWRTCVAQHQTRSLIAADAQRATEAGISSTPSFLIGGQLVPGAYPAEVFRQVLDSALAAAGRR